MPTMRRKIVEKVMIPSPPDWINAHWPILVKSAPVSFTTSPVTHTAVTDASFDLYSFWILYKRVKRRSLFFDPFPLSS